MYCQLVSDSSGLNGKYRPNYLLTTKLVNTTSSLAFYKYLPLKFLEQKTRPPRSQGYVLTFAFKIVFYVLFVYTRVNSSILRLHKYSRIVFF